MERLTRKQVAQLIQERLDEKIYDRGGSGLGYQWSWGIFRGQDIRNLPTSYLYWHLCNNDDLSRFHLEWMQQHFAVCSWQFEPWEPTRDPSGNTSQEGYYADTAGGYYDGSSAGTRTQITEDYYWYSLRSAQGSLPGGTTIIKPG